jgi:hypothetical protein
MKLKTCLMAAALAVAFIAASSAHAMDYSYRVFGKQIVIDATGEIEMDEASRLFNWINEQRWGHRKAYTIVFDSPGGYMVGGVQMASVVERFRLNTGVAHGGECASACVMAWAAGVQSRPQPTPESASTWLGTATKSLLTAPFSTLAS